MTRGQTHGIHPTAILGFTAKNGNELVEYSSIQNRNQILKAVSGILQMTVLNISENSRKSTCSRVLF